MLGIFCQRHHVRQLPTRICCFEIKSSQLLDHAGRAPDLLDTTRGVLVQHIVLLFLVLSLVSIVVLDCALFPATAVATRSNTVEYVCRIDLRFPLAPTWASPYHPNKNQVLHCIFAPWSRRNPMLRDFPRHTAVPIQLHCHTICCEMERRGWFRIFIEDILAHAPSQMFWFYLVHLEGCNISYILRQILLH